MKAKIVLGIYLATLAMALLALGAQSAGPIVEPSIFWHEGQWQTYENDVWRPYGQNPAKPVEARPSPGETRSLSGATNNASIRSRPRHGVRDLYNRRGFAVATRSPKDNPIQSQLGEPNVGIGQTTIGIGQPNGGMGLRNMEIGQRNAIGQTTIGIGQPNGAIGQTTIAIGPPISGLGQRNGIGQTTIGIGQLTVGMGPPNTSPGQPNGIGQTTIGIGKQQQAFPQRSHPKVSAHKTSAPQQRPSRDE